MIPLAEVRELLGYAADVPSDAVLTDLIRRAIARIEARTGRYFGLLEVVTEIVPGTRCWTYRPLRCRGGERLYLTDIPTVMPDAYEEDEQDIVVIVDAAVVGADLEPLTDFVLRQQGIEAWLERTGGGFWDARSEYHVTYIRGYAEGNLPADIRDYVLQWISRRVSTMGSETLESESIGGYSYRTARDQSGSLDELESSIARWIRPVIA